MNTAAFDGTHPVYITEPWEQTYWGLTLTLTPTLTPTPTPTLAPAPTQPQPQT